MIKRINTLKALGRFTELHCVSGSEGEFSKLNVIYAKNACGKSTLCDVLRSLSTGDQAYVLGRKRLNSRMATEIIITFDSGSSAQTARFKDDVWQNRNGCPCIYIYDDRFVAENVYVGHFISVDQRRNLYDLVIGDHAIALKQAVDTAEENLNKATAACNTARDNLARLLPEGYDIDSFRDVTPIDDVDIKIQAANDEFVTARQKQAKADSIRQRRPLSLLRIAEVPGELERVLSTTLDSMALVAEQKIREHLTNTSKNLTIDWVQRGHREQKGTLCPHCGQDMQGLEILKAYHAYFSEELQSLDNHRQTVRTNVNTVFGEIAQNNLRETLVAHDNERTWWQDAVGVKFQLPPLRERESILTAFKNTHKVLIDVLARKQASPGNAIDFTKTEREALAGWQAITAEFKIYNDQLSTINATLEQNKLIAGVINLIPLQERVRKLTASKRRNEQTIVDAYAAYDTAIQERTIAQQAKTAANEAMREQSNQFFNEYGAKINELLVYFAADFRIVSDGVSFRGGPPSGMMAIELLGTRILCTPEAAADASRTSLANTLSGGDRSALALAYFLARIELDPDIAGCVVVFDDPYHNQDCSRRQCTIERIHHLATLADQCIVLSHDLEFARAVEKCSGIQTKTFVLNPLVDSEKLMVQPLPLLPSQAYLKNYHLLHHYSEDPSDHLQHLKEVADTLRVILEEYLRFKFPKAWGEDEWLGGMIEKIRNAHAGTPLSCCLSLAEELGYINTYSRRFHHGSSGDSADEPDPQELKTFVNRTLKVIHAGGNI